MDITHENQLAEISRIIVEAYYKEKSIQPIGVKIEFTEDLYKRRLELAISKKDSSDVIESKEFISKLNGTIILPAKLNDTPYILISNNTVNSNMLFISTKNHELTHIHDFYDFAKYHNVDIVSNIDRIYNYHIFYYWTEFHARRNGYYFYNKFTNNNENIYEQIQHINKSECPFHMEHLKNELIKAQNNPKQFLYNIMQFLGRFSVWHDLFPEQFNQHTLPEELVSVFGIELLTYMVFCTRTQLLKI